MEQPFTLWLQDNWIVAAVAVVAAIAAIAILWRLLARRRPEEIAAPVAPPAEPAKPLEPAKPDIVAAEPARFKPREPAPAAAPEPPAPAPETPAPAAEAGADNLQLLKGVGPKLAALLTGLGITSFRQIADWTDADIAAIDAQLGNFQGRIARDNLVDQAGYLARGDKAGFEAKYGALGGEL